VYRANRIVNFAQGDLGAVPTLGVMLVVAWGWSYWLGLAVGLVGALVLGVLVETLIIRRFFNSPRLLLTVATIGISQILAGLALFIPRAFGNSSFGTRLPQPFDAQFTVSPVIFNANDIFTMIVVPVCLVALAVFLQRSKWAWPSWAAERRPGVHARHPGQAPPHRGWGGGLGPGLPGHVPAGRGRGPAHRAGAAPVFLVQAWPPPCSVGSSASSPSAPPPSASGSSTRP
jgi:hypothetical protein